jgi:hypothetical protein
MLREVYFTVGVKQSLSCQLGMTLKGYRYCFWPTITDVLNMVQAINRYNSLSGNIHA